MRLLVGLAMSLIIAIGGVISFVSRTPPVFPETRINAERFSVGGLAKAGNRILAAGALGHILYSDDEGKTWADAQITPQRGSPLTQVLFLNDKEGIAVGNDGWILRSTDGGLTWQETRFETEHSEPLLGIWGLPKGPIFVFGSFGRFFVSQDSGQTWQPRDVGIQDRHLNGVAGDADGRMMMVGEQGIVLRSSDGGVTWETLPKFYKGSFFGVIRLSADEWILYGMRGHVFYSRDFGTTWQQSQMPVQLSMFGHMVREDGAIVLVGAGGAVVESHDRGTSFTALKSGGTASYTSIIPLHDDHVLIAGEDGVHKLTIAAQRGNK
ncbi:MAG TPA: YCF48-related protein [Rhodocyclaceae bacterium]|nr:YCF48-related protein [Rhodocyclaceae bacterium]